MGSELALEGTGTPACVPAPPWAFKASGSAEGKLKRLNVMDTLGGCLEEAGLEVKL